MLQNSIAIQNETNKELYQSSCQFLQEALLLLPSQHYTGKILSWLLQVPQELFSLLAEKDPMACMVLLHFGMALHLIRDQWYAGEAGARLVRALLPPLADVQERELVEIIDWAGRSTETPCQSTSFTSPYRFVSFQKSRCLGHITYVCSNIFTPDD